jgi:hypothetical protein
MARWEPNAGDEVLFGGQDILAELFSDAIRAAPPSTSAADCLATALGSVAAAFTPDRHDFAPQRQAVIAANGELQERQLLKRARLAEAVTDALRASATTLGADAGARA